MRLDPFPRFPADKSQTERKLTDLFRDIAKQVNDLTEGKISAVTNAATSVPTTGTYQKGDVVRNSAPTETGTAPNTYVVYGWICTVAGTPGTWEELRIPTDLWSGGGGGGSGNGVTVTCDFGAGFTDKAQTVVTGQAWVTLTSEITAQVKTPSGTDPDEMYLLDLRPVISDLVAGTGFTVTLYSETEATGTFDVMCVGV